MIAPIDPASLTLDESSPEPLFRQIHRRIAGAVLDGRLAPGARLPSARSLAAQLSIARGTVDAAYQLLAGEGYIVSRGAAGTLVDPALDRRLLRPARTAHATPVPMADHPAARSLALFRMGVPALDLFPHKAWSRLIARRARALGPLDHAYQEPAGDDGLRLQIARYLAVARGVSCAPSQIFITSGYQGALGLITRALMKPGDAAWLEHPGYPNARDALRRAGMKLVGVPVDAEGFDVGWALSRAKRAGIVFVTPTHQYPLGVTLSLPRRMALLKWAEAEEGWIVEDDYDSEFRYHGKPLPALKSLDRRERVLYGGTFSKVLSPGLRVGYLV
ncbi:MAG TPA: PLP-dependent aminotransferase family protein, partial [Dongiaceae bacterium]